MSKKPRFPDLRKLTPSERFTTIANVLAEHGVPGLDELTANLTDRERQSLLDQVKALAKGLGQSDIAPSPADLAIKYSAGRWRAARHLTYISNYLVKLESRELKRLLISIGPRHGKSWLTDVWFVVWWLVRNPRARVILVGYGESFAREWGGRVRDIIIEYGEAFNLVLNKEKMAADDWELTEGGGMICVGVGGQLMGRGADLLIFDDLVKSAEEAESEVYREKMWNWIQSTALTRLQPHAAVVGLMTRWHQDDVFGRLIEHQGDQWHVINIPSLATENDPLGRSIGEPLWPEQFDDDPDYSIRKASMSDYYWNALHQGTPTPPGGDVIKEEWFQFYTRDDSWLAAMQKDADQWCQSWDPALLDRTTSDYWVGQVWARKGATLYLVDQVRGHFTLADASAHIKLLTLKYPRAVAKVMENTAMGPAIKQTLQHEVPGIIPLPAKGSKRSRVEAVTPYLQGHNVQLPQNRDGTKPRWVWDLVAECCSYPRGSNDDQVDSLSQAITFLVPGGWRQLQQAAKDDQSEKPTPVQIETEWFAKLKDRALQKADRKFGGRRYPSHRRW